jgi:hypothetical protein
MNVFREAALFSTQENDYGETREERKENGTSFHVGGKVLVEWTRGLSRLRPGLKLGATGLPSSLLGEPTG